MVTPCSSTSRATQRDCTGDGASKRNSSSTALPSNDGSSTSSWRWSGCWASVTAPNPSMRATVSVPASEMSCTKPRISSSVSVRVFPSSSISACTRPVSRSSCGSLRRCSMSSGMMANASCPISPFFATIDDIDTMPP